jgi:hypothetical protein
MKNLADWIEERRVYYSHASDAEVFQAQADLAIKDEVIKARLGELRNNRKVGIETDDAVYKVNKEAESRSRIERNIVYLEGLKRTQQAKAREEELRAKKEESRGYTIIELNEKLKRKNQEIKSRNREINALEYLIVFLLRELEANDARSRAKEIFVQLLKEEDGLFGRQMLDKYDADMAKTVVEAIRERFRQLQIYNQST